MLPIINSGNFHRFLQPIINGRRYKQGLVRRDFKAFPVGSGVGAVKDIPLIPRSEWPDRIRELEKNKARLSDVRRTALSGGPIPSLNQTSSSYCFPAGTLVRMADGSQRRIEDVKVAEYVVTAEGNVGKVLKTMVREIDSELVTPLIYGHSHLSLTSEHPILTDRGYVEAANLTTSDFVCFPKYSSAVPTKLITVGDYVFDRNYVKQSKRVYKYEYSEISRTCHRSVQGRKKGEVTTSVSPDVIELTEGFGRIAGFFLAEGHTSKYSVVWSFNVNEKDTYVSELAGLLESELGVIPKVRERPNNVMQVSVYSRKLAMLFESLFSTGARYKRLHPDLCSGPKEFLRGVLLSWICGDRNRNKYGVSVSRELALNMFDIANALNLLPILATHIKGGRGKDGISRLTAWKTGWAGKDDLWLPGVSSYRAFQHGNAMWRKVRGISRKAFKGNVYNLEVEGDSSYIAEGIGVHNCWAHSTTHGVMLRRATMNLPYEALSAYSVACKIKNFKDQGGWGALSLQFANDRGIMPQRLWPQGSFSRAADTAANWEVAANYRVYDSWADLNEAAYDRNLTFDQLGSLLLSGIPVIGDHYWWGHSILHMDLLERNPRLSLDSPARWGTRIWNSWGDEWGELGEGILEGEKAVPDGGTAPLSVVVV